MSKNIPETINYIAGLLTIQIQHFYLFEALSLCLMTLHPLTLFSDGEWNRRVRTFRPT